MKQRIWALILAALFLLTGIVSLFKGDIETFFGGCACAAVFVLIWYLGYKKKNRILSDRSAREDPTDMYPIHEQFTAVGIHYYSNEINKLACLNRDWQKNSRAILAEGKAQRKIYQYHYINEPVKLIREPQNPHDKNAIFVTIAGHKVGYISTADNLHVQQLMSRNDAVYSAFIGGGKYRVYSEDGEYLEFENNLSIRVTIKYKLP